MALPWMKPKSVAGVIVSKRKPDDNQEVANKSDPSPVQACAEEIMKAIEDKDAKALAYALEAAFTILDSAEDAEPEA